MPLIGAEERAAVDRVLRSGRLVQGEEVAAFEEEFSNLVDGRSCVAVSSGTAALHLALLAADIGPGDEVIVPSFTFAATANAVRLAGAVPVFADIAADTFCLDPEAVRSAIGPRTAAVIAVHLFGHPAAVDELQKICERRGLLLLEDAAQAHASSLHGRPAGAWGAMAAFSFYPTKNMTTGEGGLVVASDAQHLRRLRLLRNQGMEQRYHNEIVGFNARLTEMGAAIGRVQLTKLSGWTERRQANAARYDAELKGVEVPRVSPGAVHVYHQYTVRATDREALRTRLAAAGVEANVYYPIPVHRLPSFKDPAQLPVTERACAEVLSLPIGPHLTGEDLDAVVRAVGR